MNWHQRIDRAEKAQGFIAKDRVLARSWVTCACGEQDSRIPRHASGEPINPYLSVAGLDFCKAVRADEYNRARAILATIEARAAGLLDNPFSVPARLAGTETKR